MTRFEGHSIGPGSDWRAVLRGAPWLSEDRARYWADVIDRAAESGLYTHEWAWRNVVEPIVAEIPGSTQEGTR